MSVASDHAACVVATLAAAFFFPRGSTLESGLSLGDLRAHEDAVSGEVGEAHRPVPGRARGPPRPRELLGSPARQERGVQQAPVEADEEDHEEGGQRADALHAGPPHEPAARPRPACRRRLALLQGGGAAVLRGGAAPLLGREPVGLDGPAHAIGGGEVLDRVEDLPWGEELVPLLQHQLEVVRRARHVPRVEQIPALFIYTHSHARKEAVRARGQVSEPGVDLAVLARSQVLSPSFLKTGFAHAFKAPSVLLKRLQPPPSALHKYPSSALGPTS